MGLADTTWVCDDWLMDLHYGDCDPDYAGIAELYHRFEDNTELTRVFSGVWRMEDDCLRLDLSAGVGTSLSRQLSNPYFPLRRRDAFSALAQWRGSSLSAGRA